MRPWTNSANVNAMKGAGIQAATIVADKGAKVLPTGYYRILWTEYVQNRSGGWDEGGQ